LARMNTTLTDRHGRFQFSGLFAGTYTVTAQVPEAGSPPQVATVEAGETDVVICFDDRPPRRTHFEGRVVDAISGAPLERVTLTAVRESGGGSTSHELTAPRGHYELAGLEPGRWTIRMSAVGYYPEWVVDDYAEGEQRVEFQLYPTRTVRLRVLDHRGAALGGARITFQLPDGQVIRARPTPRNPNGEVVLDDRGEAEVEGLPAREVVIRATLQADTLQTDSGQVGTSTVQLRHETMSIREVRLRPL
ncbi:MAG: carboxypeptidase regulatory-like domain-containing protein, partial [Planctomycetes bacterium]|nr:carboxypeptidase regulatory-like domain-containing protein [Planctomycetota bacterium]